MAPPIVGPPGVVASHVPPAPDLTPGHGMPALPPYPPSPGPVAGVPPAPVPAGPAPGPAPGPVGPGAPAAPVTIPPPPDGYGALAPPPAGPVPPHLPGAPLPGVDDPHGIGPAVGRLGVIARRSAKVPVAILSAVLVEGDTVEALAYGRFRGAGAVAAFVGGAVVLVNDRQWKPDVARVELTPELLVHGWQDDRTASLTFVTPSGQEVLDSVDNRPQAIELAQRVRERVAALAAAPPSPTP
jgi:hypothetical protein